MKDNFPRVLSLLEYIKQNTDFMIASTNLSVADTSAGKSFDNLPLRSTEEIVNFDARISVDATLRSKLATYLSQIGGHSAKDNIVRILRRIFDNKVAQDCSWMGLRKNFRVGTLITMAIIREAVEVNFPHSEKEFEEIASDWFRHAKQRYIRDQKKELTRTKSTNTQPKIKILKVEDLKNDDIVARIKLELSQQWSLSKSDSLPVQKNSVLNHWLTKDVKIDPDDGKLRIQQVEITKVESDDTSKSTTRKPEKHANDKKILTDASSEGCVQILLKNKKMQTETPVKSFIESPTGKEKAPVSTSKEPSIHVTGKTKKPRGKKNVVSIERMQIFKELTLDKVQPKPKHKPACESSWEDIKKPVDTIRCIRCNELYKRQVFLAHSKVCRGMKPAKKFRCLKCSFTHEDIKTLSSHVEKEHAH